ncbi:MAG TPA: hypothetical protein VHG27_04070, partial [Xanthobacteraceae bacterium]|nr:hypothetical protein [Xanthobacteraceae bacterium]
MTREKNPRERGLGETDGAPPASGMRAWIAFWNSENSIYVNARHRDVHYRLIAEHIAHFVKSHTEGESERGRQVVVD